MMAQDFYAEGRGAPEGATQRKSNFYKAFARRGGIKKILVVDMVNAIVSHIKTLRSNHRLLSALCVKSSALQCQCVESVKRQWQTCLILAFERLYKFCRAKR
ncbi:MAG: hypothetical protein KBS65_02355 [Prevotella sp.]|nr:hypothetical protein [Candidatus Equicola stercoris]